jgi:hypothetical protein
MANELNIALSRTGLTLTAQLFSGGASVGSAITLSEVGSSGFYSGNMTGAAGTYQLAFIAGGVNVGSGEIIWDGTNELSVADAVWEEALTDHTTSGTYGARVVRSTNSNNQLQLTGSHHAAADIHELQPAVITSADFDSSVLTAFAVPELQEIHLIHGLKSGSALTVTPTSRAAGAVSQTIGGDGTTNTTVTRV